MKYVLIIPAGAADAPVDDLDGLTPLEAAEMPNLSVLTRDGRVGAIELLHSGSAANDISAALVSLLGVSVDAQTFGSAGLLARSLNIELGPTDWAFVLSFVTINPDTTEIIHHRAGGLEPSESRLLLESLSEALADRLGEEALGLEFVPGEGDLHLFIDRSDGQRDYRDVETRAPMAAISASVATTLPRVPAATRGRSKSAVEFLHQIVHTSRAICAEHEVNKTRQSIGELPATQVALHGMSGPVEVEPFAEHHRGLKGCMITTDDVAAGAALALGFQCMQLYEDFGPDLPWGEEFRSDPTHEDLAAAAVRAIEQDVHDLICIFVESPREAAYEGDFAGKVAALESIDRDIIGPVHRALIDHVGSEHSRIIVAPDHAVLTMGQKPDARPVPFVINGAFMESVRHFDALTEKHGDESDLRITPGEHFLEYALFSGLPAKW